MTIAGTVTAAGALIITASEFADTINIAIQPLDAAHSALAIYSSAPGGPGDVHIKRVQRWLDLLGVAAVG